MKNSLTVVTVLGKDRPGLVADLTGEISSIKGNIVDIEQSVIRGLFSMFMLVDLSSSTLSYDEFSKRLNVLSKKLTVDITLSSYGKYEGDLLPKKRELENVTLMGQDRPGIVAAISSALYENGTNIERIKMVARGDLLVMEMTVDRKKKTEQSALREKLQSVGEKIGMDIVVQPESAARMRKRLVVFDMDSTIVDAEIIDELAKACGVGKQVSDITARGMEGTLDFEQSLRERVHMLRGLPVETLAEIRDNMKLTPGSEELLRTLKGMGFKLALISGGFTYFTDELKNKLGFDYAYANELVIKDGKVTGEVTGQIIDSKKKADIVQEIMKKEGLAKEEVVAVGDGANDRIMIKNAGLGIAFNAKEVLKKVADGSITKNNLKGLIYCLGIEDTYSEEKN